MNSDVLKVGSRVKLVGLNALATYNSCVGAVTELCNDGKVKVEVDNAGVVKVNRRNCMRLNAHTPHHREHSLSLSPSRDAYGSPTALTATSQARRSTSPRTARTGEVYEFTQLLTDVTAREGAQSFQTECAQLRQHNADLRRQVLSLQGTIDSLEHAQHTSSALNTQSLQQDFEQRLRSTVLKETMRIQEEAAQAHQNSLEMERLSWERSKKQEWKKMQDAFDTQLRTLAAQRSEDAGDAERRIQAEARDAATQQIAHVKREFEALFAKKVDELERRANDTTRQRHDEANSLRRELSTARDDLRRREAEHTIELRRLKEEKLRQTNEAASKQSDHVTLLQNDLSDARAENAALRARMQYDPQGARPEERGGGGGGLTPMLGFTIDTGRLRAGNANPPGSSLAGDASEFQHQQHALRTSFSSDLPDASFPRNHRSHDSRGHGGGGHANATSRSPFNAPSALPGGIGGLPPVAAVSPASAVVPARPALATLYEGVSYKGVSAPLSQEGVYNIKDLQVNIAKSATLAPGVTLGFHEGLNGEGPARTVKADAMIVSDFNDQLCSVRVQVES